MIQFPTLFLPGAIVAPRTAGSPLSTTSDFALALAGLVPPAPAAVDGEPVRQAVAASGKTLPEAGALAPDTSAQAEPLFPVGSPPSDAPAAAKHQPDTPLLAVIVPENAVAPSPVADWTSLPLLPAEPAYDAPQPSIAHRSQPQPLQSPPVPEAVALEPVVIDPAAGGVMRLPDATLPILVAAADQPAGEPLPSKRPLAAAIQVAVNVAPPTAPLKPGVVEGSTEPKIAQPAAPVRASVSVPLPAVLPHDDTPPVVDDEPSAPSPKLRATVERDDFAPTAPPPLSVEVPVRPPLATPEYNPLTQSPVASPSVAVGAAVARDAAPATVPRAFVSVLTDAASSPRAAAPQPLRAPQVGDALAARAEPPGRLDRPTAPSASPLMAAPDGIYLPPDVSLPEAAPVVTKAEARPASTQPAVVRPGRTEAAVPAEVVPLPVAAPQIRATDGVAPAIATIAAPNTAARAVAAPIAHAGSVAPVTILPTAAPLASVPMSPEKLPHPRSPERRDVAPPSAEPQPAMATVSVPQPTERALAPIQVAATVVEAPTVPVTAVAADRQTAPVAAPVLVSAAIPTAAAAAPKIVAPVLATARSQAPQPRTTGPTRVDRAASAAPLATDSPAVQPAAPPTIQRAGQAFAAARFAAEATVGAREGADPLASPLPFAFAADAVAAAAAPAAPAAPLPVDTARREWVAAMIERIETIRDDAMETGGLREARVRLAPERLGGVDVIVRTDGGEVSVQLTAETPAARGLIAEAAPRLTEMADARGLKLTHTGVDGGTGGNAQPQSQPHSQGQSHQPTPLRAPAAADTDQTTGDDERVA